MKKDSIAGKVLSHIKEKPCKVADIMDATGLEKQQVRYAVQRLMDKKAIRVVKRCGPHGCIYEAVWDGAKKGKHINKRETSETAMWDMLDFIKKNEGCKAKDIEDALRLSASTVSYYLTRLRKEGRVEMIRAHERGKSCTYVAVKKVVGGIKEKESVKVVDGSRAERRETRVVSDDGSKEKESMEMADISRDMNRMMYGITPDMFKKSTDDGREDCVEAVEGHHHSKAAQEHIECALAHIRAMMVDVEQGSKEWTTFLLMDKLLAEMPDALLTYRLDNAQRREVR